MQYSKKELAAIEAAVSVRIVPLNSLVLDTPYQMRTVKHTQDEVKELAASIQAAGRVLQNLVVVDLGEGKYAVAAGEGRTRALHYLRDDKKEIADNYPVSVLIVPAEHAAHASLIENHFRKPMNPADVAVAYCKLREDGMSVEKIAAAHGAAVPAVRKMLALGDVDPSLLDLFRNGEAELEEMQALASVLDHERQRNVWAATEDSYNRAWDIRRILSENDVPGYAALARYVTVSSYKKAGGAIRCDLFAQKDRDVFLTDSPLLNKLADEKMARSKLAKVVAGEGWKWVERRPNFSYEERQAYGSIARQTRAATQEEQAALDAMQARVQEIQSQLDAMPEESYDDAYWELSRQHEDAVEDYSTAKAAIVAYRPEQMAYAGCVIHLDSQGALTVTRGLVRQEDRADMVQALQDSADPAAMHGVDLPQTKTRPVHSDALVQRLRAQRVIAAQAELASRPNLALCLFVAQLVISNLEHVSNHWRHNKLFDVAVHNARPDLHRTDDTIKESSAWKQLSESINMWTAKMPRKYDELVDWLLQQAQADIIELQALLLSLTVYRQGTHGGTGTAHVDSLARRIDLDMTKWWEATAASYFGSVSKEQIETVVVEADAGKAGDFVKMKKAAAAAAAEKAMAGKGWLPEPLQTPPADPDEAIDEDDGQGDDQDEQE